MRLNLKKILLTSSVGFAVLLIIGLSNFTSIKAWFRDSSLIDLYLRYVRDGAAIDADHLITKLHNGMSIVVNKNDRCVCWSMRFRGYWDLNETKALAKIVQKDFQIVEVGSNFGVHTLYMADLVGKNGKIYAFEANPHVSKYLKQSVILNGLQDRIEVFEMGASNKNYKGFMQYGIKNIGGGFILDDTPKSRKSCEDGHHCTPIQVTTLDTVILAHQKIDMLKMDVEGAEFWILEGAKSLLLNPDILLMMEWDTEHFQRNQINISEFIQFLKDQRFYVWAVVKKGQLKPLDYASLMPNPRATFDLVLSRHPDKF